MKCVDETCTDLRWRRFFILCLETQGPKLFFVCLPGRHFKVCQSGELCQGAPEAHTQETAAAEGNGEEGYLRELKHKFIPPNQHPVK